MPGGACGHAFRVKQVAVHVHGDLHRVGTVVVLGQKIALGVRGDGKLARGALVRQPGDDRFHLRVGESGGSAFVCHGVKVAGLTDLRVGVVGADVAAEVEGVVTREVLSEESPDGGLRGGNVVGRGTRLDACGG